MDFKKHLSKYNLTPNNCVVIGSGILDAKGLRESHDIDVVVKEDVFNQLKNSGEFEVKKAHGRDNLIKDLYEICSNWNVLGKDYYYEDLLDESEEINGVRYITLYFLFRVKKSWTENDEVPREKDFKDIELIESYLSKQSK